MLLKTIAVPATLIATLLLTASPARADTQAMISINGECSCEFYVAAAGHTLLNGVMVLNATVHIEYSFVANGVVVTGSLDGQSDGIDGFFNISADDVEMPGVDCSQSLTLSVGSATMFVNGTNVGTIPMEVAPATQVCSGPPPQGKTFDIGPSSMEGHLLIKPGDWISGGYSFKFVSGTHAAETVTVSSTLTMPFKCADGTTGQFTIDLGTQTISVPANNTDWQPTGDANSVLSWAGYGMAPQGCGPGQIMDNSKGAIFEATVSTSPDAGQLLNWRFKYRDPNAKGKGNVNCLDTTDPRRNKADVCGASWSQTVRDP